MHSIEKNQYTEQRVGLAKKTQNAAQQHARSAAERKSRGTVLLTLALVVIVGLLAFLLAPVAQAQKGGGGIGGGLSLEARVAALESENTVLKSRVATLESENATQAQQITALQSADTALGNRITPLETKTASLSVSGTDFIISGMNVQIVDGTGSTESASGLGNLTIGYNALRDPYFAFNLDFRTGSHNLILGDLNNYSSYGGLVAGRRNTIGAPYASVSGGNSNTASGQFASISGGYLNTANGQQASVSGGYSNTANGLNASVFGGYGNTASGPFASVSGGIYNTASGDSASVSGGYQRSATGFKNWAAGGLFQEQ
jgi:cell division protein FtsB